MDRPRGLEGHKYATWDMPVELAMIKNVVEADGGDYDKIELIPSTVTDEVSALQSNSVDAIWIFYGWAGVKMELEDLETDYFAFSDINPVFDYYTPVIIGNDDFLQENPETAIKFLTALRDGYEFSIANPQEAAEILCSAAPELDPPQEAAEILCSAAPELDPELAAASQDYLANQYKADVERWGYIDSERWNAFYQWLNENDLAETELPMNAGFSNAYLPE